MSSLPPIERYQSSGGARIYRIPVDAFSGLIAYCYVILDAGVPTLVDTGSGYGSSNDDLLAGFRALKDDFGENLALTDLKRILVTHGHIDHFGGLGFIVGQICGEKPQRETVQIGIHQLDRRVLTAYE